MVDCNRMVAVEVVKNEAQILSSIQFIVCVGFTRFLALGNLSWSCKFFWLLDAILNYILSLKLNIPNYDLAPNILKILRMLGKF